MNVTSRALLGLLLGAAALTSCDYQPYSPGKNPQFTHGFDNPPGYRLIDVDRDSVNYKQRVTLPGGVGSAADLRNGSVQDQLDSAPGSNGGTPQSASGQLAPVDQGGPSTQTGPGENAANVSNGQPSAPNAQGSR